MTLPYQDRRRAVAAVGSDAHLRVCDPAVLDPAQDHSEAEAVTPVHTEWHSLMARLDYTRPVKAPF